MISEEDMIKLYEAVRKKEALYSLLSYLAKADSSDWEFFLAKTEGNQTVPIYDVLMAVVEILLGKASPTSIKVLESFYNQKQQS